MITAAIVGASGYAGAELIRLLLAHPQVRLGALTSRAEAGADVASVYPNFSGQGLRFVDPDAVDWAAHDVVFFATPHATAMYKVPEVLDAGCRVVDLSADFRLRDAQTFADWYGVEHAAPQLLAEAVYGLPELSDADFAGARLIACAGCYPTAVELAVAPALAAGLVDPQDIIADCKTGLSGAGRGGKVHLTLSEAGDSFSAYGSAGHRHQPEIAQELSRIAGAPAAVYFQPHLVPMIRGIHATVYLRPRQFGVDWQQLYADYYAGAPFVRVREPGAHPATRDVRASNSTHLALRERDGRLVVLSVIDNLVKGASGQAVQCLNRMYGWPEDTGVPAIGPLP